MDILETIWSFNTLNFNIKVVALTEYDSDLSWDESGETAARIATGDLVEFCVRATVTCTATRQTLATDYLGNCVYATYSAFKDNLGISKTGYGSYFSDMVSNVCREARMVIQDTSKLYTSIKPRQ